jgi:hypothetical protein
MNVDTIGRSTSEQRQALRHLLHAVLDSTTGDVALNFIDGVLGRRVMVLSMSSAEIDVVMKALKARMEA